MTCLAGSAIAAVHNGAEGAVHQTLAAGYAAGLAQAHIECGTDDGGETTLIGADDADSLYLFTGSGTAAAEDTFAVVTDHVGRTLIDTGRSLLSIVVIAVFHAQLLT